jgi:hypothetical protein
VIRETDGAHGRTDQARPESRNQHAHPEKDDVLNRGDCRQAAHDYVARLLGC